MKDITLDQMIEIAAIIPGLEVFRAEEILLQYFYEAEAAAIVALFTVRTVERGVGCHIVCKTADPIAICNAMLRERKISLMIKAVSDNKRESLED